MIAEVSAGRLFRGDTVYVPWEVYARLSPGQLRRLWTFALETRVRLVTDLSMEPPVLVLRNLPQADAALGAANPPPAADEA
jgi:hypothetical protein